MLPASGYTIRIRLGQVYLREVLNNKAKQNSKRRLCEERDKTVHHIINEYSKLGYLVESWRQRIFDVIQTSKKKPLVETNVQNSQ